MRYFRFYYQKRGGHYHVKVRGGTRTQFDNKTLPLLGTLTMDEEDWAAFFDVIWIGPVDVGIRSPMHNVELVQEEEDR